ncbi:MAG: sporulation protein YunB [Pelotomaculum sp.]|uniref:Sporulation protein YunB n=1 Tax=Pelotomaculum thermopropionicum (strain DSM 13744 / JCM 10971 / SI) TaxID=370438 RepID=A5D3J5_PELTS|nr:sporulation protein YunB [Pelotomaculum sp.]BAF59202.1 hypothetical protein PTH_1021 [Pelotomaculum thermopropionicum SI]
MFKRRRRFARVLAPVVFCLAGLGAMILIDITLRRTFFSIAEVKAVQLATEAVQKTLQEEISNQNLQYQDFISIHKDNQGRVAMMQANTVKVNRVAASTTLALQKTLEELRWQTFSIPLGQVLGIPMLATYGPKLSYHVMPVGTVRVNIVDKFESAGINQTRHTIYLSFDTSVRIVVPSKSGDAVVATQVPLAESIIVGIVPNTFVNVPGNIFGGGLLK